MIYERTFFSPRVLPIPGRRQTEISLERVPALPLPPRLPRERARIKLRLHYLEC